MALEVVLRESAREDLNSIYAWIEREAGPSRALSYVQRIRDRCASLGDFPDRGTPRPDLGPGLRTISFKRKAVIAYSVHKYEVQIVSILHHGRNVESTIRD